MTKIKEELSKKLSEVPLRPGVYFWKDQKGTILYIGKAKSLRNRMRSYLSQKGSEFPKITILMSHVVDFDYVETSTEVDALILEATLIREHQPKYNKELKDDKSFPLIKITNDEYPRVHITRQKKDKKAIYYGPFTDAKLLRQAVNLIHSLFPIRKCQTLPKTACLYYHIGQCIAPCIKDDTHKEYNALIDEVRKFLGGGKKDLISYLTDRMKTASSELRFEDALFFKEQIDALSKLKKKRFSQNKPEKGIVLSASLHLKQVFNLDRIPEKIVCFDISNIQGDEAVASRVAFHRELPDKLGYRRYKIKTVEGINDFAMLQEAVSRMLMGIKEGREEFVPDLIMVDGGKGQLSRVFEILKEQEMDHIPLISIAKKFEWIYKPGDKIPIVFDPSSPVLHLLQKIRDEAHRFAISYHRGLKEKQLSQSVLDDIEGIGDKRKKELLKHFDNIDEIKRAGLEQLKGLPGIDSASAEAVFLHFRK